MVGISLLYVAPLKFPFPKSSFQGSLVTVGIWQLVHTRTHTSLPVGSTPRTQDYQYRSRTRLRLQFHPLAPVHTAMPLDTSAYSLALLRVDGRRWNELRRCHAQIRTQAAADGSSYLEMGNTKVMCVVTGPTDQQSARRAGATTGAQPQRSEQEKEAEVAVSIVVAGFSSVDRKRRGRGDKSVLLHLRLSPSIQERSMQY